MGEDRNIGATFCLVDIAGYTELTEMHGEIAAARLAGEEGRRLAPFHLKGPDRASREARGTLARGIEARGYGASPAGSLITACLRAREPQILANGVQEGTARLD